MQTQKTIDLQNSFGFVDDDTFCGQCGELLTRDNSHWAFGSWWHKLVKDCEETVEL